MRKDIAFKTEDGVTVDASRIGGEERLARVLRLLPVGRDRLPRARGSANLYVFRRCAEIRPALRIVQYARGGVTEIG